MTSFQLTLFWLPLRFNFPFISGSEIRRSVAAKSGGRGGYEGLVSNRCNHLFPLQFAVVTALVNFFPVCPI